MILSPPGHQPFNGDEEEPREPGAKISQGMALIAGNETGKGRSQVRGRQKDFVPL